MDERPPYRLAPTALHQRLADELVLLDLRSDHYYGLDANGVAFLEALLASPSLESAVDVLTVRFAAARTTLLADVKHLLDELLGAGLVEIDELAAR